MLRCLRTINIHIFPIGFTLHLLSESRNKFRKSFPIMVYIVAIAWPKGIDFWPVESTSVTLFGVHEGVCSADRWQFNGTATAKHWFLSEYQTDCEMITGHTWLGPSMERSHRGQQQRLSKYWILSHETLVLNNKKQLENYGQILWFKGNLSYPFCHRGKDSVIWCRVQVTLNIFACQWCKWKRSACKSHLFQCYTELDETQVPGLVPLIITF